MPRGRTGRMAGTVLVLTALLIPAAPAGADGFTVVGRLPHDSYAYTEGLVYHAGRLYESTGLYGQSTLRMLDAGSGRILQRQRLPAQLFGEGLALVGDRLIQLTWKAGRALVYRRRDFAPRGQFRYTGEGWGLTYDGRSLIMSDGSSRLYFRDPQTFRLLRTVTVTDHGRPLPYLNELEYIDGEVWANVYQSPFIVRIDPLSGQVRGRLDFSAWPTAAERTGREDVLNGIAWDPGTRQLFVTGKNYAYIYRVRLDRRR